MSMYVCVCTHIFESVHIHDKCHIHMHNLFVYLYMFWISFSEKDTTSVIGYQKKREKMHLVGGWWFCKCLLGMGMEGCRVISLFFYKAGDFCVSFSSHGVVMIPVSVTIIVTDAWWRCIWWGSTDWKGCGCLLPWSPCPVSTTSALSSAMRSVLICTEGST